MSLRNYLSSRVFFGQALAALAILAVLGYFFVHWLTFTTDHGHEITVPNLAKLTEEQVEEKLDELDLDYVLLDSVDYNSDFPKYSAITFSTVTILLCSNPPAMLNISFFTPLSMILTTPFAVSLA